MASAKLLLLGVLALAEAASISYPARPELDVNFNNFGFKFGAKFDSKESPRDGGKIYMDIPVNTLRRILRNPSVFEQILSPFKEEMYLVYEPFFFHRLYDVSNIKMEIEYNNEYNKDMTMMMNWNAKYAMTHQDGSEETGTIKMDSKVDSWWPQSWMVSRIYRYPFFNVKEGQMNLMVIPSGDMQTKFVFRPMEMKVTRTPQDVKFVYTFQNNKYEGHMVKNGRVYETKMMMTSTSEEVTPCEMVWKVDMEKKKAEFMRSENNVMKTNMMMEFEGQDMKTWTWKMTGSLERTWMWEDGTPMEWVVKRNGPKVEGSFTFNNFKFGKFNLDMEAKKFTANFFFFNGMFEVNFDVATGIYTVTLPKEWFGNFMTSFKDNKNIKMELKTEDFQWFNVGLVFDNFRNYKLYLPFKNTLNFYRDDVLFYTVLYQDKFIEPLGYEAEMLLESKDSKLVDSMFDVLRMDKDYFCRSMINGCFTKGKYTLKTLPELFYFQVEKEDQKVLEFDLKRKISPDTEQYVMKFFYPRWFMKTMNKQFDTLTMDMDAKYTVDNSRTTWPYNRIRWIYHHVTMKTNWDDWNMEMKRVPGNMWFTVKNNDFSRKFNVDYEMGEKKVNEFMTEKYMKHMKFTAMRNEELVADFVMDHKKPNTWKEMTTLDWMINFKDESFVHQKMCDFSTHLCFKNFNYKLQVKPNIVKYIPVSYNVDHTVTKDNKNVLDFQTRFQGEQLKSISMDTPYLVPFWKYITTPRSMLSRYFDPLPTMLSPFEIKVDMDFENGAKMRGNIDMNKFSIDITPKGSDKYNMKFTMTPEAGEMVTKELEFTMTETTIEYKQLKAWKDNEGIHFEWTTDSGLPQYLHIKRDYYSLTFSFDLRNSKKGSWKDGDFHMLQDIQVFRPYNTGKRFNWYIKWNGEGEMPYLQNYKNEGSFGMDSHGEYDWTEMELITMFKNYQFIWSFQHHGDLERASNIFYILEDILLKNDFDFEWHDCTLSGGKYCKTIE